MTRIFFGRHAFVKSASSVVQKTSGKGIRVCFSILSGHSNLFRISNFEFSLQPDVASAGSLRMKARSHAPLLLVAKLPFGHAITRETSYRRRSTSPELLSLLDPPTPE